MSASSAAIFSEPGAQARQIDQLGAAVGGDEAIGLHQGREVLVGEVAHKVEVVLIVAVITRAGLHAQNHHDCYRQPLHCVENGGLNRANITFFDWVIFAINLSVGGT